MKKLMTLLLALALAGTPCALAQEDERAPQLNCMTIVVGKSASATGRVLVGHNEEDDGRLAVRHGYVPAADWPQGSALPAESGCASVPQAQSTLGYYWSQYKAADGGLTGADTFLNEKGVLVVSNNNADSRENIYDPERLTEGGVQYNLRRIVAERAASAREALEIIIDLVETWGYAPSGRAYTVADQDEAFMIQIVSGKRYIAARVPDDMVVMMPNHYTFHGLDDYPEMYYSPDLVEYAIQNGWYTPQTEGDFSDFDFAAAYQDPDSYMTPYNVLRQQHGLELLLGREWDVESEGTPFAVPVERPVTAAQVGQILSTHYEGTADDSERFGPGQAPHDTRVRRICTGTTQESLICQFEEQPLMTTLWTAFGRPCQLPYLPLHPLCGVVAAIDALEDPAASMARHFEQEAGATNYQENGWQQLRNFENALEMLYSGEIEGVSALLDQLHRQWAQSNQEWTAQAAALLDEGKMEEAVALLHESDQQAAAHALSTLADYAQAHFNTVAIEDAPALSRSAPQSPYTVTFSCPDAPVEEGLIFGLGGVNLRLKYAPVLEGSLVDLGGGRYQASFDPYALLNSPAHPGLMEFYLGGRTQEGQPFTGMALVEVTE